MEQRMTQVELEGRISEIEKHLHKGLSVNQIMRVMKVKSDRMVRVVISKYPQLREISLKNGKQSQKAGNPNGIKK